MALCRVAWPECVQQGEDNIRFYEDDFWNFWKPDEYEIVMAFKPLSSCALVIQTTFPTSSLSATRSHRRRFSPFRRVDRRRREIQGAEFSFRYRDTFIFAASLRARNPLFLESDSAAASLRLASPFR